MRQKRDEVSAVLFGFRKCMNLDLNLVKGMFGSP